MTYSEQPSLTKGREGCSVFEISDQNGVLALSAIELNHGEYLLELYDTSQSDGGSYSYTPGFIARPMQDGNLVLICQVARCLEHPRYGMNKKLQCFNGVEKSSD